MTISRRSFVAAAIAAIAGGGSVAAAAVAVKKEPQLPVVPPAKSPEPKFDFGPVDWDNVPRAKWGTASRPRETHYLGRSLGYNGYPDMVASLRFRGDGSGAFDVERLARSRLAWALEKATAGDGILYRVLPEVTCEDGAYPGEVIFRQYARAVGERKTVKQVVQQVVQSAWGVGDFVVDMIVEYDSTVGDGEIAVICKAPIDLIQQYPFNVSEIMRLSAYVRLCDEARDRWGMASLQGYECQESGPRYGLTFRQSIRRAPPLPSYCYGFPPTAHIAAQFRG